MPEGLVSAVVGLVDTGPVLLGAYTIAELTAVDAIVDFLEARPSDEALAEAVRSLAARQLIVAGPPGEQVQVRGDLGIAVAFEQRARLVLDARATGIGPGEPWRILLLPQPEQICLCSGSTATACTRSACTSSTTRSASSRTGCRRDRGPGRPRWPTPTACWPGPSARRWSPSPSTPPRARPRSRATARTWCSSATRTGCTCSPATRATGTRLVPGPAEDRDVPDLLVGLLA